MNNSAPRCTEAPSRTMEASLPVDLLARYTNGWLLAGEIDQPPPTPLPRDMVSPHDTSLLATTRHPLTTRHDTSSLRDDVETG